MSAHFTHDFGLTFHPPSLFPEMRAFRYLAHALHNGKRHWLVPMLESSSDATSPSRRRRPEYRTGSGPTLPGGSDEKVWQGIYGVPPAPPFQAFFRTRPVRSDRVADKQARQLAVLSDETGAGSSPNALAYQFGVAMALDVLALRSALLEAPLPEVDETKLAQIAKLSCPVTAKDLQPKFSGPALGAELKRLEQLWVASNFKATKAELLR